ncbi:MAG: hypothetical protein JO113_05575 [Candidatus Eremiobacteraeota bacterium]|nr:hypothetical protein [Candidatus Eremiobacteraeota bacterium]
MSDQTRLDAENKEIKDQELDQLSGGNSGTNPRVKSPWSIPPEGAGGGHTGGGSTGPPGSVGGGDTGGT